MPRRFAGYTTAWMDFTVGVEDQHLLTDLGHAMAVSRNPATAQPERVTFWDDSELRWNEAAQRWEHFDPEGVRTMAGPVSDSESVARHPDGSIQGNLVLGKNDRISYGRPIEDFGDYLFRAQGLWSVPMRLYELADFPDTKIGFTEYQARTFARLAAQRALRQRAATLDLSRFSGSRRARLENWLEEATRAETHPLTACLSPQEAADIVRELPDARLLKRLLVLDRANWLERWRRLNGEPDLVIVGEAIPEGDVLLFRPPSGRVARDTIFHEWAHLLKLARPTESRLFDLVGGLEPIRSCAAADATKNHAEAWAVLVGEELLSTSSLTAIATAHANPIRATVAAWALRECLASVPPSQRSVRHDQFVFLTSYIELSVRPQAQAALAEQHDERAVALRAAFAGQSGCAAHESFTP